MARVIPQPSGNGLDPLGGLPVKFYSFPYSYNAKLQHDG
jgi:hypothetical protein